MRPLFCSSDPSSLLCAYCPIPSLLQGGQTEERHNPYQQAMPCTMQAPTTQATARKEQGVPGRRSMPGEVPSSLFSPAGSAQGPGCHGAKIFLCIPLSQAPPARSTLPQGPICPLARRKIKRWSIQLREGQVGSAEAGKEVAQRSTKHSRDSCISKHRAETAAASLEGC